MSSTIDPTPFSSSTISTSAPSSFSTTSSSCTVDFSGYSLMDPLDGNAVAIGPLSESKIYDVLTSCCDANPPVIYQDGCSGSCSVQIEDKLIGLYECIASTASSSGQSYYISCPDCDNGAGVGGSSGNLTTSAGSAAANTGTNLNSTVSATGTSDQTTLLPTHTTGTHSSLTASSASSATSKAHSGADSIKLNSVKILGSTFGLLMVGNLLGGIAF